MEPWDNNLPGSTPSVAMRGGLCGVFVDFDLLPRLLARAERGGGDRTETTADWSTFLDSVEFEQRHIDPDQLPSGLSVADRTAADAWRFAERMGFVDLWGANSNSTRNRCRIVFRTPHASRQWVFLASPQDCIGKPRPGPQSGWLTTVELELTSKTVFGRR